MNSENRDHDSGLRGGALGVGALVLMVVSAVAPLTNMAAVLPIAILFANGTAIVPAFFIMLAILLVFIGGFVLLAKHVRNAGAFYNLIGVGLGRRGGGAAAAVALLGYNAMQIGASGLFGPAASSLVRNFTGQVVPWWVFSIAASIVIGLLAYRRIDFSVKILGFLVMGEFAAIFILDLLIIHQGVPGGFSLAPISLSGMPSISALAVTFVFAFGCYAGFEATVVYREETKNPDRTVPRATYLAVLIIGIFYTVSTIWIIEGAGTDGVVKMISELADPVDFVFIVADRYAGSWLVGIMRILFVSSVFAALLAFHNHTARYFYFLGREGFLPSWLGKTHETYQSPARATVLQTIIAVTVIAIFAIAGADPLLTLFAWVANVSILCIISMMVAVTVAIVVYFRRNPDLEPNRPYATLVSPIVSGVCFLAIGITGFFGFDILTGTTGPAAYALPMLIPIAAVFGILRSDRLKLDLVHGEFAEAAQTSNLQS